MKRYWIDYARKRQQEEILKSGETDDVETFVTHPFIVENNAGKYLGVYIPNEEPSLTVVK